MTAGMLLLALLTVDTSKLMSGVYMTVLGIGMGFLMRTTMRVAQNSVEQRDLGVVVKEVPLPGHDDRDAAAATRSGDLAATPQV